MHMKDFSRAMNTNLFRRCRLALALIASLSTTASHLQGQGFGGIGGAAANTQTRARSSTATTYPSSTQMGTATVSVDAETRRVFVVTDDETAEYVKQVVQDLDRPTPQVLIKCLFLEATYNKATDIGIDGIYSYTASGSSIDQFNGAGTVGTAFNLASGGGLYTFTSAAGDLNVTISALAKNGKLEILSRPSILARNNQPASISLGQQVPLITNTRFDNFGNQINSITYQDVGIILNVTPFITEDNLVEMIVAPQISELADQSQWVPISSGGTNNASSVSAPVINSRSADTVVVVPDGQTVIIGGLMSSRKIDSTEKVPILGDIPVLGMLFKHKITSNGKTELMIFMTPHIIRRPSDLAAMTSRERAQTTTIAPKAFTDEEINSYLDTVPAADNPAPKKK
jgi:type II secretion system protein D